MPDHLLENFAAYIKGHAAVEQSGQTVRLVTTNTTAGHYTDAQIDDYQGLPRRRFPWRPPLLLRVRARFSHPSGVLQGTAGFGFWNDPFMMTGRRWPTLPAAVWFFYASPPSNLKLDLHIPGYGWKAATIDAWRWPFFALLPSAPLAIPLMNNDWLYQRCWPIAQRAIQVSEALLPVNMTDWHTYTLSWQKERVHFAVDEQTVLDGRASPRGPLGFVLWLDNQYMIVTPWGRFGYGLLASSGDQWLEISELMVVQTKPVP